MFKVLNDIWREAISFQDNFLIDKICWIHWFGSKSKFIPALSVNKWFLIQNPVQDKDKNLLFKLNFEDCAALVDICKSDHYPFKCLYIFPPE